MAKQNATARTQSTDYWSGLRDGLTGLALDFGRAKINDIETKDSDRNVPDRADIVAGTQNAASKDTLGGAVKPTILGLTHGQLALAGVGLLGAGLVLRRLL